MTEAAPSLENTPFSAFSKILFYEPRPLEQAGLFGDFAETPLQFGEIRVTIRIGNMNAAGRRV